MSEQTTLLNKKTGHQIHTFETVGPSVVRNYGTGGRMGMSSDEDIEQHNDYGDYIKSIVYGGLDGIITSFAVVNGVAGAHLPIAVILVLGFSNLVADGVSMGVGDYLSEVAEIDFIKAERKREEWEFSNNPQGEIDEMVAIYTEKGIEREDAEAMLECMCKYPDFFIDHMLVQEIGVQPVSGDESPAMSGFVTMCSFMVFGVVPLISYLVFAGFENGPQADTLKFVVSTLLTFITLGALGAVKGKMTESSMITSAAFVCVNGGIAAAAAFAVGFGLGKAFGLHNLNG